jgi:hypothetical protein
VAPAVLCFLESTKSVLEGYEKVRLGVSNGRRVIAVPLHCSADRPQYSFPNIRGKSLSFPNGSLPFDLSHCFRLAEKRGRASGGSFVRGFGLSWTQLGSGGNAGRASKLMEVEAVRGN